MVCCFTVAVGCMGQSMPDWKLWTTSSVKVRTHNNFSLDGSYFTSYDFSERKIKYDQWRFSATYSPKKRWYVTMGYVRGQSKKSKNITHRVVGNLTYPSSVQGFDFIRQYFTVEGFYPATSKYAWRMSYAVKFKETLVRQPFAIAPYASGRIFYFYGGRPIQRYNLEGEETNSSSGDGFHRFRGALGVDVRPTRYFQVNIFCMIQREFNLGLSNSDIHVVNPNSGDISRRFSNYTVLGLSGKIRLDLRRK